jgi:hypothetical protein
MQTLYKEYKKPLSVLNNETDHINNNPLQSLAVLFGNVSNEEKLKTAH